ncbi:DUF6398 domain-containing protein [Patulibacter sp. NPDC049589]|uniref:DUF6398 domain-containing protein n=1 Tax=Patulibacter sp. NPDC049589 TaxID=3154731 RepID=UPI003415A8FB
MSSKRSRGNRSRAGSSSRRAKRRQGHPASQTEARRRGEEEARDAARRATARRDGALAGDPFGGDAFGGGGLGGDADLQQTTAAVAAGLRRAAARVDGPLRGALLGSEVCEPWATDTRVGPDGPEADIGIALVRETASFADSRAVAALRALELGATERTATAAARAAEVLVADGQPDPAWYAASRGLAPVAAGSLTEDQFDDGRTILIEFAGPAYEAHTIGVYVDRNMGGLAKDLLVGPPLAQLQAQIAANADHPDFGSLRFERIDLEDARRRATLAMARSLVTVDPPFGEDVPVLWGLVLQRLSLFDGEIPPEAVRDDRDVASVEERDRLFEAFFASPGAPDRDDASATIVASAIDFAADYAGGDPARWSPVVVEMFMVDFLPRKATFGDETFARLPDVLRSWVRFAAEQRGVGASATEEAVASVGRWEDELRAAVADQGRWGPAKAIGMAMQEAGVDLTDQAAIDRFIAVYNASLPAPEDMAPPHLGAGLDPEIRRNLERAVAAIEPVDARGPGPSTLEPLDLAVLRVPVALREAAGEIVAHTDRVALQALDAAYARIAREIVARLARKRPSPLARGRREIWAAGVLHAAGTISGLAQRGSEPYLTADGLAAATGVPKGTITGKSARIRDELDLRTGDAAVTHPSFNDLPWYLRRR